MSERKFYGVGFSLVLEGTSTEATDQVHLIGAMLDGVSLTEAKWGINELTKEEVEELGLAAPTETKGEAE